MLWIDTGTVYLQQIAADFQKLRNDFPTRITVFFFKLCISLPIKHYTAKYSNLLPLSITPITTMKTSIHSQSRGIDDPRNLYIWGRELSPKYEFPAILCFKRQFYVLLL